MRNSQFKKLIIGKVIKDVQFTPDNESLDDNNAYVYIDSIYFTDGTYIELYGNSQIDDSTVCAYIMYNDGEIINE